MRKSAVLLPVILLLTFLMAGCGANQADRYKNLGKCDVAGDYKQSKGTYVVCAGEPGNYRWYSEGKYFDEALLLGETAVINGAHTTFDEQIARDVKLQKKIPNIVSVEIALERSYGGSELASYTAGDARWDGLIAALSEYRTAQSGAAYACNVSRDTFNLFLKKTSNLITRKRVTLSEVQATRQECGYANDQADKATSKLDSLLSVLENDISGKMKVGSTDKLIEFALLHQSTMKPIVP
jgi:hypothetical protein